MTKIGNVRCTAILADSGGGFELSEASGDVFLCNPRGLLYAKIAVQSRDCNA